MFQDGLKWFKKHFGHLENLEHTKFVAAPKFINKKEISFKQVITALVDSSMENEYDEKLKQSWAKQGFSEFLEYFKLSLPNASQWRFWRRIMKCSLLTGDFRAKLFQNALSVKKYFKNETANFELDQKTIDDWTTN